MTFNELNLSNPLLNALTDLEYFDATPIQYKAFAEIMSGKDMIGIAQTGTGKTFAYLLPILRQLTFSEQRQPRVLIIVPTRELVKQVCGEIEKLAKYMTVRFTGIYGGANIKVQKQTVYDGLDILVATPGRLIDIALSGVLRLSSVQRLVIDEVEEMLNLGFRQQVVNLIEMLPQRRQNIMFSATLNEDIEKIISDFFNQPKMIEVAAHGTPLEQIIQKAYYVPNFYTKRNLLQYLLSNDVEMNKVLIFTATKKLADRLYEELNPELQEKCSVIHSNKSQNFRFNALQRFHDGTNPLLITTDIMARGLDIFDVSHVINFDMPQVSGNYIHRIGRTGRAGRDGIAISFINRMEEEYQAEIEKMMNKTIDIEPLPETVEISKKVTEDEKPTPYDKNYMKEATLKDSKGAYHEKSSKNLKTNSGGLRIKRKLQGKIQKRSKRG